MRRAAAIALIAACAHLPPAQEPDAPRTFFLRLLEVGRSGDVDAWRAMLSKRKRERMADPELARMQMDGWVKELSEREAEIRAGPFKIERAGPYTYAEAGKLTATVAIEDGELRLDEN